MASMPSSLLRPCLTSPSLSRSRMLMCEPFLCRLIKPRKYGQQSTKPKMTTIHAAKAIYQCRSSVG
ncbi:hypothetical protein JS534_07335 [Bifidobacterium felsineum]|nr:hypothetical protein [Bifidobacterium felsineum]